MIWMLDADTVSFAIRGEGKVKDRLLQHAPSDLRVSAITAAELWYGVERRGATRLRKLVKLFLDTVGVEAFPPDAAVQYGALVVALQKRGRPSGVADAMVAAHAIAAKAVLVSHNRRHFGRVPGLRLEDWY
ncbi:MAG: PIN domain-containing protein [Planctomycetes bacterium]|nr:PIN domain-containing protein [Planctomycetota bacterium]